MIPALAYLQYHSTKNRLLTRLKRLKQPKYLIGAIVGGLYFYFYFFNYVFKPRPGATLALSAPSAEALAIYESIGALILLVLILGAWIFPNQRAALTFTEAEIAFLFPAPVSRRGLIHFKLLRSQIAILFTIVLLTLFTSRLGGRAWIRAAGCWVVLSTLNLHFLGASFVRTMLLDRGITNLQRRLLVLGFVVVLTGGTIIWIGRTIPTPDFSEGMSPAALKEYLELVLLSGPVPYLLLPFRYVARPFLAANLTAFIMSVWPALLILVAHYWWVVRSNVAFEEASVEASQRLAEKISAIRQSGGIRAGAQIKKVKRAPFKLRPDGPAFVGLIWKNVISAGQIFSARTWTVLAFLILFASVWLRSRSHAADWAGLLGAFLAIVFTWSLMLGPQFLRQDFRQDLRQADILKLFPMRGWQVALGELLGPILILTAVQWLLVLAGIGLLSQTGKIPIHLLLAAGFSAALVFPMLNGILFVIPNASVLLFPAWFQTGKDTPQGIEATGQRLIFLLGQVLVFLISLVPAAALSGTCFFIGKAVVGLPVAAILPLAALTGALVLGIEAGLGIMWLGWLFERFDLSAELPN
jgi:hypothetical protein